MHIIFCYVEKIMIRTHNNYCSVEKSNDFESKLVFLNGEIHQEKSILQLCFWYSIALPLRSGIG